MSGKSPRWGEGGGREREREGARRQDFPEKNAMGLDCQDQVPTGWEKYISRMVLI